MMGANQDALMSEMSVLRQKVAQLEQENHELRSNYQSLLNSSNKNNETSNPITILVPGRPPENVISEGGNVVASAEIRDPQHVSNIVVCSRRPIFSSECGGALYFSFYPYQNWEFLGVITNLKSSELITTGWPFMEGISSVQTVKVILVIEPANIILQKLETKPPFDVNKEIAKKIALNLFRYIESYSGSGNSNNLNIPQYILDKWFSRFDEKYKIDPYFYMKTN